MDEWYLVKQLIWRMQHSSFNCVQLKKWFGFLPQYGREDHLKRMWYTRTCWTKRSCGEVKCQNVAKFTMESGNCYVCFVFGFSIAQKNMRKQVLENDGHLSTPLGNWNGPRTRWLVDVATGHLARQMWWMFRQGPDVWGPSPSCYSLWDC